MIRTGLWTLTDFSVQSWFDKNDNDAVHYCHYCNFVSNQIVAKMFTRQAAALYSGWERLLRGQKPGFAQGLPCEKLGVNPLLNIISFKPPSILCDIVIYFTSICYKSHYTFLFLLLTKKTWKNKKQQHLPTFEPFKCSSRKSMLEAVWNNFTSVWRISFKNFLWFSSVGDKFYQPLFVWKCISPVCLQVISAGFRTLGWQLFFF